MVKLWAAGLAGVNDPVGPLVICTETNVGDVQQPLDEKVMPVRLLRFTDWFTLVAMVGKDGVQVVLLTVTETVIVIGVVDSVNLPAFGVAQVAL